MLFTLLLYVFLLFFFFFKQKTAYEMRISDWSSDVCSSDLPFALFFLGEYANMILMSGMTVILFLGGWLPPFDIAPFNWIPGIIWFCLKVFILLFVFIWVRATVPRYRYDQPMRLGWKVFLTFSLFWVVATADRKSTRLNSSH